MTNFETAGDTGGALVAATAITKAHGTVAEQFIAYITDALAGKLTIGKYEVDDEYYSSTRELLRVRVDERTVIDISVTRQK